MGKTYKDNPNKYRKHSDTKPRKNKGNRPRPQEDEHPGWVGQRGGMIVSGVCPP